MLKKVNVFVVDDHKMICESIAALVEKSNLVEKAFTAYSGELALQIIHEKHIHVAIIDARMPDMSGIELIGILRKEHLPIRVVAMTSYDETATLKELLLIEPDGILLKRSTDKEEIDECLERLITGNRYYSPDAFERIQEIRENISSINFSRREKEIIELTRRGLSAKLIADELDLKPSTVEDYRKELLRKIGVKNTAELIDFVHRNGLI